MNIFWLYQVKEKGEARQKELEKKRREHAARKQAEAEARQQLIREEKEKQARIKKEEDEISKEMAKIRRVMEEERKANKEKIDRFSDSLVLLRCIVWKCSVVYRFSSKIQSSSVHCRILIIIIFLYPKVMKSIL